MIRIATTRLGPPVLAGIMLVAGRARADLPPPPNYVERCTPGFQQRPGEACEICGAWLDRGDVCGKKYAATDFRKRCRTRGSTGQWDEVWCRPAGDAGSKQAVPLPVAASSTPANPAPIRTGTPPAASARPAPAAGGSCASAGRGDVLGACLLTLAFGLARAGRRRRRQA
ncbi:MAG: hypothetical protein HY744_20945 [Deltaproteobacteria bacterium]|nr:hypothetical protein [Deltaproteobacteria bacterium]